MKVILVNDVKKQGKKGDILEVKDGYGKFLVNNHLAVLYTQTSVDRLNNEIKKAKDLDLKKREEANKLKEKLAKEKIIFKVKTGSNDKVFGSISTKQIVEELKHKGYDIDKKQIVLDVPISSIGMFNVEIILYKDIKGKVVIEVTK